MTTAKVRIPPKLIPVFLGEARYRGAYGGRGSAKTRTFAKMTAIRAYQAAEAGQKGVILCVREYMNSLEDSSLEEVKEAIRSEPWLEDYFEIGDKYVKTKNGRVRYVFSGLRHNVNSVKSKANILICWADEAEQISETAWKKLIPTVRAPGSEIWITWNPEKDGSPTDKRFRKTPPNRSRIVECNYEDNPWFPTELEEERQNDLARLDHATYAHIWEGAYLELSDAQIFKNWRVEEFEPLDTWNGPYCGLDFGFAQDPTFAVRCWIKDNTLYIEREAQKVQLELDDTATYVKTEIPGIEKHVIRADSARPESISFLKRHGLPRIEGAAKWQGSVEDGIEHIKSYSAVVIHPRCKGMQREARLYSFKVDKLSGDIQPIVVDAFNHGWDAVRYALSPMIKRRGATKTNELRM